MSLNKHATFKGEAVGSKLVAQMLQGQAEVVKSAVTSYMDSQACIEATEVRKTGLGQYLVLVYLRLVDIVNDRTNVLSPADRTEFTLKWVRCTMDWQAMRVNEEAKRAPQGESSLSGELCHG